MVCRQGLWGNLIRAVVELVQGYRGRSDVRCFHLFCGRRLTNVNYKLLWEVFRLWLPQNQGCWEIGLLEISELWRPPAWGLRKSWEHRRKFKIEMRLPAPESQLP